MNKEPAIAVLYHIFYEDSYDLVCSELQPLEPYHPILLFNICTDTPGKKEMSEALKKAFPGCFVIFTSNKGKDIGAKLAMLQLFMQLQLAADYFLLLHDKKSLQALKSATWKDDLLKVIFPDNIATVFQRFEQNDQCGIVATKEYIITEPFEENKFSGINGQLLDGLVLTYGLRPDYFEFVAGTMFWVRAAPLLQFFGRFNPLEIRKQLENGNVIDNFSGTVTHSWERLLSWIVTSNKMFITGI